METCCDLINQIRKCLNDKKIIIIAGKKRSGKDTVADMLGFKKYALADLVKEVLLVAFHKYGFNEITYQDLNGTGFDREAPLNIANDAAQRILIEAINALGSRLNINQVAACYDIISDVYVEKWTLRKFLQTLGTDVVVAVKPLLWVEETCARIANTIDAVVVVTDVRQPHEEDFFRELTELFIHVRNPLAPTDNHITEQGISYRKSDITINNPYSDAFRPTEKAVAKSNLCKAVETVKETLKCHKNKTSTN